MSTGVKISALPTTASLMSSDIFPLVTGGVTRRAAFSMLPLSPMGSGAILRTMPDKVRDIVSSGDYSAIAYYDTARAALTGRIGVGILDISSGDNVAAWGTTTAQLLDIRKGTAAAPDTTQNPILKVSRTMNMSATGLSGDASDFAAAILGVNSGTVANEVQTVGVMGYAKSASTSVATSGADDACGLYGVGRITGAGTGAGIGAFLAGRRDTDTGMANGLEVQCQNYTATAGAYNSTGFSNTSGIWLNANGNSDSGVGISLSNPFGYQFKVGIGFTGQVAGGKTGGIADASIRDDSTSTTSVDIRGTHTTAISVAAAAGAVSFLNNVTLGDTDGADTLTLNSGTWTIGSAFIATRAAGAVAAGVVNLTAHTYTASGDAGGTSNIRGDAIELTVSGGNAVSAGTLMRPNVTISATALTSSAFVVAGSITLSNTGNITSSAVFRSAYTVSNTGDVTSQADGFNAAAPTLSSTGFLQNHAGFRSTNLGHATLVISAFGHIAETMTPAATLTVGFESQQNSGTGAWGFRHSGTANNAFAGPTRVGSNVAATQVLSVTGKADFSDKIFPGTDAAAAQTAAGIYAGSGAPNNANGANGDFYLRSDGTQAGNTVIYHREAAAWVALVTT